jgi:hypothetical protein
MARHAQTSKQDSTQPLALTQSSTELSARTQQSTIFTTIPDVSRRQQDIQSVTVGGQELYVDRFHVGAQTFSRRRKTRLNTPSTSSATASEPAPLTLTLQSIAPRTPATTATTAPLSKTATRDELLATAPVREYGADLQYWGQEELLVQPTGRSVIIVW